MTATRAGDLALGQDRTDRLCIDTIRTLAMDMGAVRATARGIPSERSPPQRDGPCRRGAGVRLRLVPLRRTRGRSRRGADLRGLGSARGPADAVRLPARARRASGAERARPGATG